MRRIASLLSATMGFIAIVTVVSVKTAGSDAYGCQAATLRAVSQDFGVRGDLAERLGLE